ncbi:MAG: hypothetical protein LBP75_11770 [Planctomycetota bacterium]|jgi:hypothetical protein|nr:hypothetical protein [Planctomycetota bacterium]
MAVKVAKKNPGRNAKKTAKTDAPVVEGEKHGRFTDYLRAHPDFKLTIVDMKAVMK